MLTRSAYVQQGPYQCNNPQIEHLRRQYILLHQSHKNVVRQNNELRNLCKQRIANSEALHEKIISQRRNK